MTATPVESSPDGAPTLSASTRAGRVATRSRNPKWRSPALRIDMSICINCDTCLRHCPPQFGAIFNHGLDVIIIPELCSGCGKCLPPVCPVDCIVPDPGPEPTPDAWWAHPFSRDDPYATASSRPPSPSPPPAPSPSEGGNDTAPST